MMRAFSILLSTLLLVAGLRVEEASAQARLSRQSTVVGALIPDSPVDLVSTGGPSWQSRFWNAVGGAALGAGVGYFASQLASGDWEEGEIGRHRRDWAIVGGSVGLAAGFSFPFFGRGASLAPTMSANPRTFISAMEVAGSSANTAYEAIRLLRPNWLASRRADLLARPDLSCSANDPVCEPILIDGLKVYLDGHRLGGTATLSEINARNVESIRFFNPAQAVARWGAGHGQGAILVNTIG